MSYSVLHAADAHWRPSNAMGVMNTDLGTQLGSPDALGARLWRLAPGQASTWHRHRDESELYVLLSGTGRMRVGDETLTLAPLSAVLVEPDTLRQVFNDTDQDALWLMAGAPPESPETLQAFGERSPDFYPDGVTALPPELGGGTA